MGSPVSAIAYEVYAIKYAQHARRASENFIGGMPHDAHDGPRPRDYFVWLLRGEGPEIVVDTGFSAPMAAKRGREHLRCPTEGLGFLNIDSKKIKDGGITNLPQDPPLPRSDLPPAGLGDELCDRPAHGAAGFRRRLRGRGRGRHGAPRLCRQGTFSRRRQRTRPRRLAAPRRRPYQDRKS